MSEHTREKVSDLIYEARKFITPESDYAENDLIRRLADALETEAGKVRLFERRWLAAREVLRGVKAERDEARIWAETMQEQKFEWEGKEAAVRAERDEALAVIAEVLANPNGFEWDVPPTAKAILSPIPEHPKED